MGHFRMNASQANGALEGRILAALESSRQKQRISVAELARRIGVGKKRFWYALNGQRATRADKFVKLCAFFDLGLVVIDRTLASDYINIYVPGPAHPEAAFDWAHAMDSTRRAFGNDLPWRGRRVRTYKHYVVSPDPKDGIGLEALRKLATAWAHEHFSEYEVAIIYHDDNARGIPHAHVVVNNTNIETGKRLQDPDPKALASSLQNIAERQGLSVLRPPEPTGVAARAARRNPKRAPETYRSEYVRRAEKELAERGEYS